ncbi:hypothetical protein [Mycobacteroides abscessus]|uniref:hypothetical protein n=1 Tax=Mycobacteroides abscessus TaxID=36809 RepID=UPI000929FD7E|nr:hypothetical protein [Mycobacteroides abscessus]SHQ46108.1 Uncharacterised protein [Mycobacteroides abscessus subsp. abscessus]SKQ87109.1 Uncharacterised protein [Mycobacteroides abscessus subsp. massiliense]SLC52160.1 Uncharacterised protein [Mycobacteroides abscessus subsp. massiliense]
MANKPAAPRPNVFIHDDRVAGPDGAPLFDKSPQTPGDIASLVRWLGKNRGLTNTTLWLLGADLAARFGWLDAGADLDEDATHKELAEAAGKFIANDIKHAFEQVMERTVVVQREAYRFNVYSHWNEVDKSAPIVEIVAARVAGELTDGHRGVLDNLCSEEDEDLENEVISRVRFLAEQLKIPAAGPGAKLGSRLADRIWSPPPPTGVWPIENLAPTLFEPVQAAKQPTPKLGEKLVVVDQRKAVLASMGTARFGMGNPYQKPGNKIDWLAEESKLPCAAVDVTLPATDYLGIPHILRVHPAQQRDRAVQARVSTITVRHMMAPTADGGLGMELDDIVFGDAWVWPDTSPKLATWAKHMRGYFELAGDDLSLQIMLKEIYSRYYNHLASQYSKGAHWQPVFPGLIRADLRCRALRYPPHIQKAADGLLPVAAQTDAWFYIVPPDFDISIFNAYDTGQNGKYRVKDEPLLGTEAPGLEQPATIKPTPPSSAQSHHDAASSSDDDLAPLSSGRGILNKLFGRDRR